MSDFGLCSHGVRLGVGYECATCVTASAPVAGALLALDCRCTDDYSDATCPDHGLLAFLRAAMAAEDAREAAIETEGTPA